MTRWSDLDRVLQVRRQGTTDDGFTSAAGDWADLGDPIRAAKADVSDGERWRAGEVSATVMSRFRVRWSAFTSGIRPTDRIVCEGLTYEIVGLKEGDGRRQWIEITGSARTDLEAAS